MSRISFHEVIGFLLPLPLFVDLNSPLLLARDRLTESNLAIPLSLCVLPFAIFRAFLYRGRIITLPKEAIYFIVFFTFFMIWSLILATNSANISSTSYLYAFQWFLPYFWFFYFLSLSNTGNIVSFLIGFFYGALLGSGYIFLAGFLEILIFGSLQDLGRMTQNLILPGQYQLYVYTPTVIAFSSLIAIASVRAGLIKINILYQSLLYFFTIMALLFTGAREGIFVFLVGLVGFILVKKTKYIIPVSIFALIVGLVLWAQVDSLLSFMEQSDYRLLSKIAKLSQAENRLAGRDMMMALYINIILSEPLTGTSMLQSEVAPSAHNYYVDSFAWGGVLNFALIIVFLAYCTILATKQLVKYVQLRGSVSTFTAFMAFLLLAYLLISNNINVPLRQPLTGSIGVFLIYWILVAQRKMENHFN